MIYKGLTISTDSNGVVIVNGTSTTAENEPYRFAFGGKDIDLSLLEVGQTYLSNHSIEYYLPDGSKNMGHSFLPMISSALDLMYSFQREIQVPHLTM